LAQSLPGTQFSAPVTTILSEKKYAAAVAVHPVLDRAAVRYYVAPPEVAPFGALVTEANDGTFVDLLPGVGVTVPVRADAGLRGLGVVPVPEPFGGSAHGTADATIQAEVADQLPAQSPSTSADLSVTLRDSTGRVVATSRRRASSREGDVLTGGSAWLVGLTGEDIPAHTDLTAEITELGSTPLRVSAVDGRPALATVTSIDDGLRLVYAAESVIYERTRALDRAHWASSATVVGDDAQAVAVLDTGAVRPDTVVLAAPGPAANGLPATVGWITDGLDDMALTVTAQGAGYLVLADAIQHGWKATVDGVDAALVSADRAFVAVAVPAGTHTVRLTYPQPFTGMGAGITGLTILALLGALGVEIRYRRYRASIRSTSEVTR
jgi:hypothetical protein